MIPLWLGLAAIHSARIGLNPIERLGAFISIPIHYGYDGVMLFFVLSGFVIHLPYAGARRRFDFAPYVVRRLLRLYPPYLAAIGASVLVIALTSHGKHIIEVTDVKSVLLAQDYPHGGGPTAELAALQPAGNIAL